jgi:hypothetical protein
VIPGLVEVLTVVTAASVVTIVFTVPLTTRRRAPSPPPVSHMPLSSVVVDEPVVVVRLLGPVVVERDGVPVSLTARQAELVAYLAAHPDGVGEDRLRAGWWGDRPVARGTFNNLVSGTRRRLGHIEGSLALPAIGEDRRYRLHPAVACDLTILDHVEDHATAARLLAAVRGRPFDASRGYGWADRDGLTHWAATRIAAVAHDLAADLLNAGHPERALTAAAKGLLGTPGDERLYGDRMLAHAALGDGSAVERVMVELLAVFDAEDPVEVLHPDTLEVYRRCGGRPFVTPRS